MTEKYIALAKLFRAKIDSRNRSECTCDFEKTLAGKNWSTRAEELGYHILLKLVRGTDCANLCALVISRRFPKYFTLFDEKVSNQWEKTICR